MDTKNYKIINSDTVIIRKIKFCKSSIEQLQFLSIILAIIFLVLCFKTYLAIILFLLCLYQFFSFKEILDDFSIHNSLEPPKNSSNSTRINEIITELKNKDVNVKTESKKDLNFKYKSSYSNSEFHKEVEELLKRRENYLKEKAERKPQREKEYIHTYNLINFLTPTLSDEKVSRNFIKNFPKLTYSSIRKNTPIKKLENFISIDLETTGLRTSTDEIIEISAVKFINGEATECLSTLIKPKKVITEETIQINHITNEMVENAPKIQQVIPAFKEFIKGSNIIGYNLEFDLKFLYVNGLDFFDEKRQYFDVLKICKSYLKDTLSSYKLDNVCDFSELYRTNAHRASEDAFATGLIFRDIGKKILDPNYNYYE